MLIEQKFLLMMPLFTTPASSIPSDHHDNLHSKRSNREIIKRMEREKFAMLPLLPLGRWLPSDLTEHLPACGLLALDYTLKSSLWKLTTLYSLQFSLPKNTYFLLMCGQSFTPKCKLSEERVLILLNTSHIPSTEDRTPGHKSVHKQCVDWSNKLMNGWHCAVLTSCHQQYCLCPFPHPISWILHIN